MIEDINKIEIRSEEVQEILGNPPAKIIQYGITIIFIVVAVIIIGSFYFTYPDILVAPIRIYSQNPAAILVARANGTLEQVLVSDSQEVNIGQLLAIVRNPASFQDIIKLQTFLDSLKEEILFSNGKRFTSLPSNLQLGSLQDYYSSLYKKMNQYHIFLDMDHNNHKIALLKEKECELSKYARILEKQSELKKQEHQINIIQFNNDSVILNQNMTSKNDFNNLHKTSLQSEMEYESSLSSVENVYIQLQELQQSIEELTLDQQKETVNYQTAIDESLFNLKLQLAKWKDNFILLSPIEGIVAFNKLYDVNQEVSSGDELFTIIPKSPGKYSGRININSSGISKIKVGQQVTIKLDDFPSAEFGLVSGLVSRISKNPFGGDNIVEVIFPDNLRTNNSNILPFKKNMTGTAEIVTDNIPFILRLFNPMKSILKKKKSIQ